MEFLIIVFVFISVLNAVFKKGLGLDEGEDLAETWKNKVPQKSTKIPMPSSTHDVERVMHEFKSRAKSKARQVEENRYQKEEQERKNREQEARRSRELEEQRREAKERQRKQAELKDRLKKEQARKAQAEKDKKASKKVEKVENPSFAQQNLNLFEDQGKTKDKETERRDWKEYPAMEEKNSFRISDYLDPLTASFYPGNQKEEKEGDFNVDDYLFPTIAPFYPKVDEISFSLQNPPDMI